MKNSDQTDTAPAIAFRTVGVTKVYQRGETEVHALRGVDIEILEGEFAVLMGPSGSGKSTLLNILGGLDSPTAGTVFFRDRNISALDAKGLTTFRRDSVGFIFQFYNLIPSLTACENIGLVTEIAQNPMPPEEALRLVDLSDRTNHFPSQLSGGEQQRVAVARAIAKRPEVLLCDEPTGALDSATGVTVMEVLERVNAELGTTTMVITHNTGIADMADRVLAFGDGQIVATHVNTIRRPARELAW